VKFRCAYCQQEFGPEPSAECPHCHKTMMLPDAVTQTGRRDRERAKDKIRRDAERQRRELFVPDAKFGRKPTAVLFAMMALIVIGGLLVKQTDRSKESAQAHASRMFSAARNVDVLKVALERFRRDCGRYPTAEEGLEALVHTEGVKGWKRYVVWVGPDPWGRPYQYALTGGVARVFSCGPDGARRTGDDILPKEPSLETINRDLQVDRVVIPGVTDVETNRVPDEDDGKAGETPVESIPVRILLKPPRSK